MAQVLPSTIQHINSCSKETFPLNAHKHCSGSLYKTSTLNWHLKEPAAHSSLKIKHLSFVMILCVTVHSLVAGRHGHCWDAVCVVFFTPLALWRGGGGSLSRSVVHFRHGLWHKLSQWIPSALWPWSGDRFDLYRLAEKRRKEMLCLHVTLLLTLKGDSEKL